MKFLENIIHTVVPHEKNRNIPHLLKKEFVTLMAVLVVLLFFVNQNNFSIIKSLNLTGAIYPAVLADLTNESRASIGLAKLAWNNTLEQAAKMKGDDMVKNNYFAHTSPKGITPWYWLSQAKYNFIYAGENLAIDFTESKNVQDAWFNSTTHRANLLHQNYTEIGITAIAGTFEGRDTTFVVEFFGKPQASPALASTNTRQVSNVQENVKIVDETERPGVAGASTEKFIAVQNISQNTSAVQPVPKTPTVVSGDSYSTWYMHLAVSPTNAIKAIYGVILGFVLVAMLLVISKEYQKHHFKHLMMGVLLIVLTGAFMYLIKSPAVILAFS